jgi:hypothetical protein
MLWGASRRSVVELQALISPPLAPPPLLLENERPVASLSLPIHAVGANFSNLSGAGGRRYTYVGYVRGVCRYVLGFLATLQFL